MRRKLSLTGSIISLVGSIIMLGYSGYMAFALCLGGSVLGSLESVLGGLLPIPVDDLIVFIAIMFILGAIIALIAVILNAKTISATCDAETLLSKKKMVVWAIVLNFMEMLTAIISGSIFYLIAIALLASNILMIIDLNKSKNPTPAKETVNYVPQSNPYTQQNTYAQNYASQGAPSNFFENNTTTQQTVKKEKTLEERLSECDSMLKRNIITEDEYEQMRKKILSNYL